MVLNWRVRAGAWGILLGIGVLAGSAMGATVPYVETFAEGDAGWMTADGVLGLEHVAGGGADGDGHLSDTHDFLLRADGDSLIVFRANGALGASGSAFVGNWLAEGVGEFRARVRHDAPVPLHFFTRFAPPGNFPAAFALEFVPVPPNTWTELSFEIAADNPSFVTFEGSTFENVFSNISRIQIGADVPDGFGGTDTQVTFDLDQVAIQVPEPASVLLTGIAALALVLMTRHRR